MIDPQEHIDAIYNAGARLRLHAEWLRESSTVGGDLDDWNGDEEAFEAYEAEKVAANDAEAAGDYLADLQSERDELFNALLGLVEEQQPLGIDRDAYQTAIALIIRIEGDPTTDKHQETPCI